MRNVIRGALLLVVLLTIGFDVASAQTPIAQNRIAYVSNRTGNEDIYTMSLLGENDQRANLTDNAARDWNPAWSPDGTRILFNSDRDRRDTLYIMNFDGSNVLPVFASEAFNDYDGAWSPDGTRIAFISDRFGIGRDIYIANADGSDVVRLTDTRTIKGNPIWSSSGQEIIYWDQPNGENGVIDLYRRTIVSQTIFRLTNRTGDANGVPTIHENRVFFDSNRDNGMWAVYVVNADGSLPERLTPLDSNNGRATVSPDGLRIAYVTDRFESDEILVSSLDGIGEPIRLTNNRFSDHSPAWQPVVPEIQAAAPPQAAAPEVVAEATPAPATLAIGLSTSGTTTYPMSKAQFLADYNVNLWQDAGWTGAGVRVGVIDTAFGGLGEFIQSTGRVLLPKEHTVNDYGNSNSDHGTKVLDVIRTIAPNAELYACKYEGKYTELLACRDWMWQQDVKIINHSVGLPIMPLDGTNEWAKLVDDTFALDILWVNASGNFQRGYFTDNFSDRNGDNVHDFVFGNIEGNFEVAVEPDNPYTGSVMLSWSDPFAATDIYSTEMRPNLDLEIVSAIDPTRSLAPAGAGQQPQNEDATIPAVEVIRLSGITEPFMVRVVNNGMPLSERIEFSIYVEYLEVPESGTFGSTIAPADAQYSLTVASVTGRRELAAYSSLGLRIPKYQKPDLSALGEIYLGEDNTDPFIGTSAAAPVVSGIAALVLEEAPTLNSNFLRNVLLEKWRERMPSDAFGRGIIRLGIPPRERQGNTIVEIPAKTVFPQIDDKYVDQGYVCPGAVETRLAVGLEGYVNYDLGLAIRAAPGGRELDRLRIGARFTVLSGPVCLNRSNWWEVRLENGALGWVSEGDIYYLIAPVNLVAAQLPKEYTTDCPHALETELAIGERGHMIIGNRYFFRSEGARNEMQSPERGSIVHILGGPVCEGSAGNQLRWYVRVIEGRLAGYEGWTAEGDTSTRAIEAWTGE